MLCYVSIADMNNIAWYFIDDLTKLYFNVTTHSSPVFCDVMVNMQNTSGQSATLMILAMTLERFYAIYFPFRYKEVVTAKKLTLAAIICVLLGFSSSCLFTITYGNENGQCYSPRSEFSGFTILLVLAQSTIMFLILPSILVAVFNVLIIVKIKQRKFKQKLVLSIQ